MAKSSVSLTLGVCARPGDATVARTKPAKATLTSKRIIPGLLERRARRSLPLCDFANDVERELAPVAAARDFDDRPVRTQPRGTFQAAPAILPPPCNHACLCPLASRA